MRRPVIQTFHHALAGHALSGTWTFIVASLLRLLVATSGGDGMGHVMVPALRPGIGGCPPTDLTQSGFPAALLHLGRRTEKYSELAVILENGRGVDEADVAESGAS